ncbi:calmodulin-2/4 [Eurytemora carolleeae]|uniref:calmodulin-2/4 n=1 Tax=Eurytemora carolleeae TaxID=1294199 RepID=UPI000C7917A9|nr:calmodulin-2/4 [Eurytemora carolleeae]|eukprot:XP_023346419.1 calmodulin-2/4-like [Eurytemora affinis]
MWGNDFTTNEQEVVTSVFRQYETGLREGVIDVKDLHTALFALGLNPMEQEIIDMTNEVSRDGLIYFPEFCKIILRKFREDNIHTFGSVMFKAMCGTEPYVEFSKTPIPPHFRAKKYKQDKHNLTYEEFLFIMRKLPVQVSEKEIREMFSVADHDNNGFIGYKEFMIMLNPPNQSGKPQEYNQQKNQNPKSFPNPKSVPAAQSTAATSNPNSAAVGKTNAAVKIEEV